MARINNAFGNLSQRHFTSGIFNLQFIQKMIGKSIIKRKRNANQDGRNKENEVGSIFKQNKCICAQCF